MPRGHVFSSFCVIDIHCVLFLTGENWASQSSPTVCLMPTFEVNMNAAVRLKGAPAHLPR